MITYHLLLSLPVLGAHIMAVTGLGTLFVLAGASLRLGGFPFSS